MHEQGSLPAYGLALAAALIGSLLCRCVLAEPAASMSQTDLRDCVAKAASPLAVTACEQHEQTALRNRIAVLETAIERRLNDRERLLFKRNMAAWQTYFDSEEKLLDLTLERRADGLGSTLRAGGVNRLYEQRAHQLREHLHNLKQARQPVTNRP